MAAALQMLNAPDQDTLTRLIDEVIDWSAIDNGLNRQIDLSATLMLALQQSLPPGVLPSHYLLAQGSIDHAADRAGYPDMAPLLTRVVTEMWHHNLSAAAILTEEARGSALLRRAAAVLARALAQHLPPGKPFRVLGQCPGEKPEYVISNDDVPAAKYANREQRLTAVGTRIVGLVSTGEQNRIETELLKSNNLQDEAETRVLVLTLALWLGDRIKALPVFPSRSEIDSAEDALNHL